MNEETAINKAHKLLLEGAKITKKLPENDLSISEIVGPPQKNSLDPLLPLHKSSLPLHKSSKNRLTFKIPKIPIDSLLSPATWLYLHF